MPLKKLPKDRNWLPSYESDASGSINDNFCINLSQRNGYVFAGGNLIPHTTESDLTGLETPSSYVCESSNHFVASDKVYLTTNLSTTLFAKDTVKYSSSDLLLPTDVDFKYIGTNGTVNGAFVTTCGFGTGGSATAVYAYVRQFNSSDWVQIPTVISSSDNGFYPIEVIGRVAYYRSSASEISSALFNNDATITFNDKVIKLPYNKYYIRWFKSANDKLYIGCWTSYRGNDFTVFEYDPYTQGSREIPTGFVDASPIVADNNLYMVTSSGWLVQFDGRSFSPIARFPGYYVNGVQMNLPHRNGYCFSDGKVRILMPSTLPYIYGGIWTYDTVYKRLYHEYAPLYEKSSNTRYGTPVITSAGFLARAGAGASGVADDGEMICGLTMRVNATTTLTGIFTTKRSPSSSTYTKRGFFVTPRIATDNDNSVDATWKRVLVRYINRYFPVGVKTGTIRLKYRIDDESNIQPTSYDTCTWVNTTSYTCPATQIASVAVGDEVFILDGNGAGFSSHIVSITGTTTKTVTIYDTLPFTASGTFQVQYQNWSRIPDDITSASLSSAILDIPETAIGDWIQFKIEIIGDFGIEDITVGYQDNSFIESK